jgi:membrane-bound lytic murein transglycosylase D
MPYTGKRFGLRIDGYVDERRDPVKSTEAAIKYLKYLHSMFDKWYLAALAYNSGEGRVQRAIKRAGSDELMVLIDEDKKYLPRETRRYIKKIVHLALLAQNKELMLQSNFDYMLNRGQAYSLAEVKVPGGESLDRVSRIIKVSKSQLYMYNPHLRHGITPIDSKEYSVYIPYMNLADFKAAYNSKDMNSFYAMHRVKRGDTLGAIAERYGVKLSMLQDFNDLRGHIIHPGQQLIVPVAKENYNRIYQRVYQVRRGDTLSKIARKFDLSIAQLKKMNDITGSTIYLGDRIVVQK